MNDPRARILARRARFVAMALGAVACGHEPAKTAEVTLPPPAEPDAGADAGSADAGETAVATVDAGTPATEPGGISPATAKRYSQVKDQLARLRASMAELDAWIAKQPAFTQAASAGWQDTVKGIQTKYEAIGFMSVFCPKKNDETDAFLAWVHDEGNKLRAEVDALKKRAVTKLTDKSTPGDARYDLLLAQYNQAHPMPCLSIACDSW